MENASKALLIAGAILIVILLIAVGMLVYSQAKGTIDTGVAQMSSAEIKMFNAQFEVYEGKQSLQGIKQLYQLVMSNNKTYESDKSKWVGVNGYYSTSGGTTGGYYIPRKYFPPAKLKNIETQMNNSLNEFCSNSGNKQFTVKIQYDDAGLVNIIDVIQPGAERFYDALGKINMR